MLNKYSLTSILKYLLVCITIFGVIGCAGTAMNFKPLSDQKDRYEIRIFPSVFSTNENEKKLLDDKAQEFASFMHYKSYEILGSQRGYGYAIDSHTGTGTFMLMGVKESPFTAYTLQFNR